MVRLSDVGVKFNNITEAKVRADRRCPKLEGDHQICVRPTPIGELKVSGSFPFTLREDFGNEHATGRQTANPVVDRRRAAAQP